MIKLNLHRLGDDMRLILDMDEVICDFLGKLCEDYNALNQSNLTPEKIDKYELAGFIGSEGKSLFLRAGFFDQLKPFPSAKSVIKMLYDEGHDIIIATNALGHPDVAADKCRWTTQHLPFIYPDNFFIASKKHLIQGDLIFDDSPHVLNKFPGIKVVMDRPYNKDVNGHRIFNNNWIEFYELINRLCSSSKCSG